MTDLSDLNSITLEGTISGLNLSAREATPCFTFVLDHKRRRPSLCEDPIKTWNKATAITITVEAYGNKALRYADALREGAPICVVGRLAPKGRNSILIIAETIKLFGAAL